MKRLAANSETFSLVRGETDSLEEMYSGERAFALRGSINGRLSSSVVMLEAKSSSLLSRGRRQLTQNDIVQVNRATVRESMEPRHWPPEVVLSFMAADVIKRK